MAPTLLSVSANIFKNIAASSRTSAHPQCSSSSSKRAYGVERSRQSIRAKMLFRSEIIHNNSCHYLRDCPYSKSHESEQNGTDLQNLVPNKPVKLKKGRESRDTTLREHEGLTSEVDDEVGGNELEEEEEDDLEYFNTFPSMKELKEIAFGKPFIEETDLAYDKEEGTIVFRKNDEKITFKMPHRMEMFRNIDLKDMNTNPIPPFILGKKNEHGKVYYYNSLIIGLEYK
ncbi:hypothetical protein Tco_1104634 [Tanacetum coccineum]